MVHVWNVVSPTAPTRMVDGLLVRERLMARGYGMSEQANAGL